MARVLYVTSVPPWPLSKNGGGQRTRVLLDAMTTLGHDVETVAVLPHGISKVPPDDELAAAGVRVAFESAADRPDTSRLPSLLGSMQAVSRRFRARYGGDPATAAAVRRVADEVRPDVAVFRYGWTVARCGDVAFQLAPRTLVDFDDVDWMTLKSQHDAEPWPGIAGRLGMAIARRTVKRMLLPIIRKCDGIWSTSLADVDALKAEGVGSVLLPNIPLDPADVRQPPQPLAPSAENATSVLFIGDLRHGPNAHGLARFLQDVWPEVRRRVPNAMFRIVGRDLSPELSALAEEAGQVEVAGFVDDLRRVYEEAAVVAVPCWWGGGTKIKVAEAAALGRAQVATRAALRGYEFLADHPAAAVVADSDSNFAEAIVRLLSDVPARHRLETAGPAAVNERLNFDVARSAVAELLPASS